MFYCKERVRLVTDWRDGAAIFSESLGQLEACKTDRARFEERYKAALLAQKVAEQAHAAMVSHRRDHGC
jgi:hypothetical protein